MNKKRIREIALYLVFGVLTTVVSWGSYTLFVNVCALPVFWANLLSWVLAVAFAYVTNKLWVFESRSWAPRLVGREIVGFLASRGITGVLEIVSVPLLERAGYDNLFFNLVSTLGLNVKILFTSGIYSKITVSVVIVLLNYVFSKWIVFRKREQQKEIDKSAGM